MECMYAQTRPQLILSSERVLGNVVRTHVTSKGKKSTLPETQRRVEAAMLCHAGSLAYNFLSILVTYGSI